MFVDSDDAITKTALEEIYTLAKKFDADVVHSEKCYRSPPNTLTTDKNFLKEEALIPTDFVNQPTLMTNNILERIQIFVSHKFDWSTCQNFIRRDFLIENNIKFPAHKVQEDTIFSFMLLCLAKNFLRVPNIFYVYQYRADSASRSDLVPPEKKISRWGGALMKSIILLDKFIDELDLGNNRENCKFAIFDALFYFIGNGAKEAYSKISAPQLDEIIRREVSALDNKTALTAFLFNKANVAAINQMLQARTIQQQQIQLQQQQAIIQQLQAQIKNLQAGNGTTFSLT